MIKKRYTFFLLFSFHLVWWPWPQWLLFSVIKTNPNCLENITCLNYKTQGLVKYFITLSIWTTIHRTALFLYSFWMGPNTHTAIYLSSCINRWIYTDIHKYMFMICIFSLKSCYACVKDSPYWMRAHSNLKTHTQNSWIVGRIPTDIQENPPICPFWCGDQKYTRAAA